MIMFIVTTVIGSSGAVALQQVIWTVHRPPAVTPAAALRALPDALLSLRKPASGK